MVIHDLIVQSEIIKLRYKNLQIFQPPYFKTYLIACIVSKFILGLKPLNVKLLQNRKKNIFLHKM